MEAVSLKVHLWCKQQLVILLLSFNNTTLHDLWYHSGNKLIFLQVTVLKSGLVCEHLYVRMNKDLVSATPLNGTHLKFSFFHKDGQNYFLDSVEEEIKLPIYLPKMNQLKLWEIFQFFDY